MKKLILKLFCLLGIHEWKPDNILDVYDVDCGLRYCNRCFITKYV